MVFNIITNTYQKRSGALPSFRLTSEVFLAEIKAHFGLAGIAAWLNNYFMLKRGRRTDKKDRRDKGMGRS